MAINDPNPKPAGKLALQTIAMPRDTNANGDIFGGWLVSQMDLAGGVTAGRLAKGRVATEAAYQHLGVEKVEGKPRRKGQRELL